MKHIKKFENEYLNIIIKYWKTTLIRPNFIIALKKINVPQKIIDEYNKMYINSDVYVFIIKKYIPEYDDLKSEYTGEYIINWDIEFQDYLIKNNKLYTYMGEIKVYDYEINSEKYNL